MAAPWQCMAATIGVASTHATWAHTSRSIPRLPAARLPVWSQRVPSFKCCERCVPGTAVGTVPSIRLIRTHYARTKTRLRVLL